MSIRGFIPRRSVGVEDEPILIECIFPCVVLPYVLLPLGTQYSLQAGNRHASTIGRMCLMRYLSQLDPMKLTGQPNARHLVAACISIAHATSILLLVGKYCTRDTESYDG